VRPEVLKMAGHVAGQPEKKTRSLHRYIYRHPRRPAKAFAPSFAKASCRKGLSPRSSLSAQHLRLQPDSDDDQYLEEYFHLTLTVTRLRAWTFLLRLLHHGVRASDARSACLDVLCPRLGMGLSADCRARNVPNPCRRPPALIEGTKGGLVFRARALCE